MTAQQRRIGGRPGGHGRARYRHRRVARSRPQGLPGRLVEERARRRLLEIQARGESADFQTVLSGLIQRDQIDSGRATAPLRPAVDAIIVDSTRLDIAGVMLVVEKLVDG